VFLSLDLKGSSGFLFLTAKRPFFFSGVSFFCIGFPSPPEFFMPGCRPASFFVLHSLPLTLGLLVYLLPF